MEIVVEKLVDMANVEKKGESSMMDCNPMRDLCMEKHG